jgi:PAS domain-containing protein
VLTAKTGLSSKRLPKVVAGGVLVSAGAKRKKRRAQRKNRAVETVRLSREIYDELTRAREHDKNIRIQAILEQSIREFLARRRKDGRAAPPSRVLTQRNQELLKKSLTEISRVGNVLESLVSGEDLVSVRLREAAVRTPATIILKNADAKVVWVNLEFERRTGLKLADLKGKDFAEIFSDYEQDYGSWLVKMERQVIKTRKKLVLIGPMPGDAQETFRATLCFPMSDETGEVQVCAIGFELGRCGPDEGRHHGVVTLQDRFSLLSEGKEFTGWHLAFLNSLPAAAVIKDKDLRIVWANKTHVNMSGEKKLESIQGKKVGELWADADSARKIEENDQHVLDSGRTTVTEETVLVKGKEQARLRIRFPILATDGTIGFLGAIGFDKSQIMDETSDRR